MKFFLVDEGLASHGDDPDGFQRTKVSTNDLLGFLSDFRDRAEPVEEPEDHVAEDPQPFETEDWDLPPADPPVPPMHSWQPPPSAPTWQPPQSAPTWQPPKPPSSPLGPPVHGWPPQPAQGWSPPQSAQGWPPPQPPGWSAPQPQGWPPPQAGAPAQYPPPNYPYAGAAAGSSSKAGLAMGLGIGSVVMPVLSIPGLILGIKSLRLVNREPWVGGRGKAIAGIVTSLILGPIVAVIFVVGVLNAINHEDMSKVRSLITSMVSTQVQQVSGTAPNVQVNCPSSEPRRAGTTFYCHVTNVDNGRSLTVQVRETDSSGDVLVAPVPSESS